MPVPSVSSPQAATSGRGHAGTGAVPAPNPTAFPATTRLRRKSTRHKAAYHYLTSSSNTNDRKSKLTTRHLAALDFLLGIKLTNEATIRKEGQKLKVSVNYPSAVQFTSSVVDSTYDVVIFLITIMISGTS